MWGFRNWFQKFKILGDFMKIGAKKASVQDENRNKKKWTLKNIFLKIPQKLLKPFPESPYQTIFLARNNISGY